MSERKHEQLLDVDEVAARCGIKRRAVWIWIKQVEGFPQPVTIRGVTRWKESELEAYLGALTPAAK